MKALTNLALAVLLAASGLSGCTERTTEQAPTQPAQHAVAYVASVRREPFHRPDCRWAQRISPANLQTFSTRDEAIKAGHRPCKVCKPCRQDPSTDSPVGNDYRLHSNSYTGLTLAVTETDRQPCEPRRRKPSLNVGFDLIRSPREATDNQGPRHASAGDARVCAPVWIANAPLAVHRLA
jgi:hypothetical protein